MNLEQRNAEWTGGLRLFLQPANRQRWMVRVDGATMTIRHGKEGAKLVESSETFIGKNVGKKNEITPERDAINRAIVKLDKKVKEGYREYVETFKGTGGREFLDPEVQAESVNFRDLQTSLCFYKPDNDVSSKVLQKQLDAGHCWYARKRNGLAYIIAKDDRGKVQMYSRRMHKQHDKELDTDFTWNDRFPQIINAAAQALPLNSIILGELVVDRDGADDFKYCQRLAKSTTPEAIQLQIGLGPECKQASFFIWDIAFWNGEDMFQYPVKLRYERIAKELILYDEHFPYEGVLNQYAPEWLRYPALLPPQWFTSMAFPTPDDATAYAKENEWEGFVVIDPEGVYGEDGYNFKGKPSRPKEYCAKLKPTFYDDFIVDFNPAKGVGEFSTKDQFRSRDGSPGINNVVLYQYNAKGEKVYICDLGVGLTKEMKRDLADPKLFPQVWEISYKDRRYISEDEDSNAMDFASFERVRWCSPEAMKTVEAAVGIVSNDKSPEECVNDRL